jgi:hypothetical protein
MFAPVYRLLGRVGWLVVALFLFLVFAATGLAALYFYLSLHMPAWAAMGIIAAVAGIASGVAVLWATRSSRSKTARVPAAAAATARAGLGASLGAGLGLDAILRRAVSRDPVGAAVAAVAAGILIESIPQLSALVRRMGSGQQHTMH